MRTQVTLKMDSNSAKEFGAVAFAEVDFEHVVVFDNVTQFNDTLFNDITNLKDTTD